MKNYLTLVLFAALCSCNDNTIAPTTKGEAILTLTGNTISLAPTRSGTSKNLQDGTEVGVYVVQTNGEITTLASTPYINGLYKVAGTDGAFVCATPFVLYDGSNYTACAYSPRLDKVDIGANALSFGHGTDVLYAPSSNVTISGATASAALSFTHQMSQISFTLVSGVGAPDLTDAVMEVSGFSDSCTMNLADGVITPIVGSGEVINQVATPICFVPGALTLSVFVKTADGKTYNGNLNRTFMAGSSYNYTLTLNKTEGMLGVSGTVVDWVTVPGGNVELNDNN